MRLLTLKHCFIIAIATTLLTYTYNFCMESDQNYNIANSQSETINPCLDKLLNESDPSNPIASLRYNNSTYGDLMTD